MHRAPVCRTLIRLILPGALCASLLVAVSASAQLNAEDYPHLEKAVGMQPINLAPLSGGIPEVAAPISWQADAACGANCLYLLVNLSGCAATLEDVKTRVPTSGRGASMADLQAAAAALGLATHVVELAPRDLRSYACPMILRMGTEDLGEDGHYVVALHVHDGGGVTLVDGTTAQQAMLPSAEFNKLFTGYAIVPERSGWSGWARWALIAIVVAEVAAIGALVVRRRRRIA